ncbi:hypothetical protein VST7929_00220 [Vibrio stylophorae]|uniref:VWA-like domain-containing protein n=1 Tax=Vibrio stylophorae TaxID=659351 RepID=A0ABM8ZQ19_9VIBR|nr:VWA-like domain-containing protein [Vibrio stylophorae]CAH0532391.1 hypothetical protein VST7929_00220 [Vibrio stylophorae]
MLSIFPSSLATPSAAQSIAAAMVRLMLAEPFYGHYFTVMQKREVQPASEDAALSSAPVMQLVLEPQGELALCYQASLWQALTAHQQVGALKQQALHLLLGHLWRRHLYADLACFDLAAELVAVQYLKPEQLADDAVTLVQVNTMRMAAGLAELPSFAGVDDYYQALLLWRPQLNDAQFASLFSAAIAQHQSWQSVALQGEAMVQLAQSQWQQHLLQAAHRIGGLGCGALPQQVKALIEAAQLRMQAQINWRRLLRLFANSARKTMLKNTLRRPSKRYGTVPGIQVKARQHLLVAVDTSGSVSEAQLACFFDEIYWIWRAGAEITVVECDVQITRQFTYRGQAITEVSGRGGTDFNAPITLANQLRVDALIYFTDGLAEVPTVAPRMPLLWLLHSGQMNAQHSSVDMTYSALSSCGRVLVMQG